MKICNSALEIGLPCSYRVGVTLPVHHCELELSELLVGSQTCGCILRGVVYFTTEDKSGSLRTLIRSVNSEGVVHSEVGTW